MVLIDSKAASNRASRDNDDKIDVVVDQELEVLDLSGFSDVKGLVVEPLLANL